MYGRDLQGKIRDIDKNLRYNIKLGFVDWVPLIVGTIALIL